MLKAFNARILLSFATLLLSAALIAGATFAFFSDTETSQNNTFTAGAIDLKIDNQSYYNGVYNNGTSWDLNDLTDQLFFNFDDVKPDDFGEDTISLHAQNDYWACAEISLTANDDLTCTEPELLDDLTCSEPGIGQGELAESINFAFWADDGDNVFEQGEAIIDEGTASAVLDNNSIVLADSVVNNLGGVNGQPLEGGLDQSQEEIIHYIGKSWCFGTLTKAPLPPFSYPAPDDPANDGVNPTGTATPEDGGFLCDGTALNNATQTDKVMADIKFTAVQSRNNPDFVCEEPDVTPSVSPTPTDTPTPTPLACQPSDVMLVLDRSGSISSGELTDLKTAAKAFVDDMGLTSLGIHAGQSSFATTGSLDHILTFNSVSLKAAVDALVAGGFTNLKSGIDLASSELSGVNDRPDGTSPDKMIIITDGHPNRPLPSSTADDVAAASATAFKAGGGEVYVVGVGGDVNTVYLQGIATDNSHYFTAPDYGALQTTLQGLDVCDE